MADIPSFPLPRHMMVRIAPRAWDEVIAALPGCEMTPLLAQWRERDFPFVVRRACAQDGTARVPLGLPLPPSLGKLRIALSVAAADVASAAPPPLLAEAAPAAPPSWRDRIEAIMALDGRVRCFGSLAFQHLTGLSYLGPRSDMDLLWPLPLADELHGFLAALAAIADDSDVGIDGEIVRGDGIAVHWRELYSGSSDLLAKGSAGPQLIARHDFLTRAAA